MEEKLSARFYLKVMEQNQFAIGAFKLQNLSRFFIIGFFLLSVLLTRVYWREVEMIGGLYGSFSQNFPIFRNISPKRPIFKSTLLLIRCSKLTRAP